MKKLLFLLLTVLFIGQRINAQTAGMIDSSFNETGVINLQLDSLPTSFYKVRVAPNGKIFTLGHSRDENLSYRATIIRYNTDGSLDASFGTAGVTRVPAIYGAAKDCFFLADGRIVVLVDDFYDRPTLVRLLPNGNLDPTFGTDGIAPVDPGVYTSEIADPLLQPDGKTIITGNYSDFQTGNSGAFVTRALPAGNLDVSFGLTGTKTIKTVTGDTSITINGAALQPDGKILVGGRIGNDYYSYQWFMTRLMPDGTLDHSFANNGTFIKNLGDNHSEGIYDIIVLPDGKILVGGYGEKAPGYHFTILRLKPDGTVDNTFGLGGKAQASMGCCFSVIFEMARQVDGKILACGYTEGDHGLIYSIARFKPNGLLDQTFGDVGRLFYEFKQSPTDTISQRATSIAIQPDNKILVAGWTDYENYAYSGILLRLNPGSVVGTESVESDIVQGLAIFPNPVTEDNITLKYYLSAPAPVSITMYDLLGRKIADLQTVTPRREGVQEENLRLPSGIANGQYFIKIETPNGVKTVKFLRAE
jgi:uncharacterized delta-60 repeat protein